MSQNGFTSMIFVIGVKYITPVVQAMLSYNRLHVVPKNEQSEIFYRLFILVAVQIMIPLIAPLFVWANLYQPVPKTFSFCLLALCAVISCLLIYAIKKKGVIESFIEEADIMTKTQHKARRKALVVKFVFGYMLTPFYLIVFCLLFQYFGR